MSTERAFADRFPLLHRDEFLDLRVRAADDVEELRQEFLPVAERGLAPVQVRLAGGGHRGVDLRLARPVHVGEGLAVAGRTARNVVAVATSCPSMIGRLANEARAFTPSPPG